MQSRASTIVSGSGTRSAFDALKRTAAVLVALILLLEGGYFLLTGLLEIINFGWRQPMFDQYKMYPHYLEFAFPENLIQLENGHRPILPIVLALAEIRWMAANQILQLAAGGICALLVALIPVLAVWRERPISMTMRAAAAAVAMIGVFWLANSRMLLHGNELLHVYLPALLVLLAAYCTQRASLGAPVRWMIVATSMCAGAMFCFGAGVAAFPAIALVAWFSRVPLRAIAVLAIGFAILLFVYLWVLPSDDGVRQMLALRPLESIATAARWIGSPWVNAWLGFADPPLYHWMSADSQTTMTGIVVASSANGLQQLTGAELRGVGSLAFGLLGFLAVAILVLKRLRRRNPVNAIENLALIMALFGAAISVLVGVGRLDNLIEQPDQIFADRYLPWSCMFWMGITILGLLRLDRAGPAVRTATLAAMMALPLLLLPSHRSWAGWGEAVYRNSQASAAAALSDVFDPQIFPNDDSALHEDVAHTLELFRQNRLAMFAGPELTLLGTAVVVASPDTSAAAIAFSVRAINDAFTGEEAATFEALVSDEIRWVQKQGPMVVLDPDDRIRGFALPSFINGEPSGPRLNMPRKRGYTGYIRNHRSSEGYRLALLAADMNVAYVLATIPPAE